MIEARAGSMPLERLRRASKVLSDHYRDRGPSGRSSLASAERIAAYLATRFPATYAAATAVLLEVRSRIGEEVGSLLDLGAGMGAAALAAQQVFPCLRQLTLVEDDPAFVETGRELVPGATWVRADLRRQRRFESHAMVIASYALGELAQADALSVADAAWDAAQNALVLIEPGAPRAFPLVLAVRSRLIELGAQIVAPCPWPGPCPLAGRDFCHFAQRVERSALHRRAKDAELNYEDEKFSYVAFSRTSAEPAPGRVIRRPEHQPGLITLQVCRGEAVGIERITKRDRDRFRAARKALWGDEWK